MAEPSGSPGPPRGADKDFCERVAGFCIGRSAPFVQSENLSQFGRAFMKWDGQAGFTSLFNRPCPIFRDSDGQILTRISELRFKRLAATMSEMAALGFSGPVRLDMLDARRYGVSGKTGVSAPVVVYNRRETAKNLVLWPLAPYHTLGHKKFVHARPIDPIAFDDKNDLAIWRGNLSGTPNKALAIKNSPPRLALKIMEDLEAAGSDEELWELHRELMGITRYNFVLRYFMSEEMDVALTLRDQHKAARNTRLLKPLCKARKPVEWFFNSKYIFSLSGNDTGSNFLMAANSNSVVLKEEDGWELFYTNEFRPWEHYIPLSPGALDTEEKLAWAKDNPKACKEMSAAARAVCARFASAENRRHYLGAILSYLANAR